MNDIASNILFVFLLIWATFWKGISMWRASRERQRNWFIALLILNTLGILDIIYLFKFAKKPLSLSELRGWFFKNA